MLSNGLSALYVTNIILLGFEVPVKRSETTVLHKDGNNWRQLKCHYEKYRVNHGECRYNGARVCIRKYQHVFSAIFTFSRWKRLTILQRFSTIFCLHKKNRHISSVRNTFEKFNILKYFSKNFNILLILGNQFC